MTLCPACAAAVLEPLVEGGVSTQKLQERAMRISQRIRDREADEKDAADLQAISDTLGWLAAERIRLLNEVENGTNEERQGVGTSQHL